MVAGKRSQVWLAGCFKAKLKSGNHRYFFLFYNHSVCIEVMQCFMWIMIKPTFDSFTFQTASNGLFSDLQLLEEVDWWLQIISMKDSTKADDYAKRRKKKWNMICGGAWDFDKGDRLETLSSLSGLQEELLRTIFTTSIHFQVAIWPELHIFDIRVERLNGGHVFEMSGK